MQNVRLKFEKTGEARFISHLDMNRMFARCFRRAGIPIWYTEGFNPHPHIVFSPPVSVGVVSRCETADIRITENMDLSGLAAAVNRCLPQGFKVTAAYEPNTKPSDIAYSEYRIVFPGESASSEIENKLSGTEPLSVLKKTKRSETVINIKEFVSDVSLIAGNGETLLCCTLPYGNDCTVNPALLCSALGQKSVSVERIRLFGADREEFI